MKASIIFSILLFLVTTTLNGQTKIDTSTSYIHNKSASFQSQALQSIMAFVGMKNNIEKDLIKGKFSQEAASIPNSIQKRFDLRMHKKNGRNIWTLKPKQNVSEKIILYIHGGAYIYNISKYHWKLIEELLYKTNATIVIPDYPLAPAACYADVYEFIEDIYSEILAKVSSENIIIMGDSAGAGFALSFAQKLRDKNNPQPSQIILLSPWLDLTMSNPSIIKYDDKDKILGIKGLQMAGKAYAGTLDMQDYKVSPIYGNHSGLGEISLFIGTHDLFIADARKFKRIMENNDIPIHYFEYPKMFHAWMIITSLKESQHAIKQMSVLINNDAP